MSFIKKLTKRGRLRKQKTVGRMCQLPRFLQNTNSDCQVLWQQRESMGKDEVTYLQVSEYSSVVPDIANSGLMDEKYYR